jgi:hypothetical protein
LPHRAVPLQAVPDADIGRLRYSFKHLAGALQPAT